MRSCSIIGAMRRETAFKQLWNHCELGSNREGGQLLLGRRVRRHVWKLNAPAQAAPASTRYIQGEPPSGTCKATQKPSILAAISIDFSPILLTLESTA